MHHHPLALIPVLHHLIPFATNSSIHKLSQCSHDCHESITQIKLRQIHQLISEGNTQVVDPFPIRSIDQIESLTNSETIRISSMIDRKENELGLILPSYLKEFVKICGDLDCRTRYNYSYCHPTNSLLPFEEWDYLRRTEFKTPWSRKIVDVQFKKEQQNKLIIIGRLNNSNNYILLEPLSGKLYHFEHDKFNLLNNIEEWYRNTLVVGKTTWKVTSPNGSGSGNGSKCLNIEKESAMQKLKTSGDIYRQLSMELKKDHEIICQVMNSGHIEPLIPFKYKDSEAFMLLYIKKNAKAFHICSNRLKFNVNFVNRVAEIEPSIIYFDICREWNFTIKPSIGCKEKL